MCYLVTERLLHMELAGVLCMVSLCVSSQQYEDPPKHIADDIAEAKRRLAQRKQRDQK